MTKPTQADLDAALEQDTWNRFENELMKKIAQAICDGRNEGLERAAVIADNAAHYLGGFSYGIAHRDKIAAAIRKEIADG